MKPVEYKHLLVSLKTLEESNTKIKELENEIKKTKAWIGKWNHPIKTECIL